MFDSCFVGARTRQLEGLQSAQQKQVVGRDVRRGGVLAVKGETGNGFPRKSDAARGGIPTLRKRKAGTARPRGGVRSAVQRYFFVAQTADQRESRRELKPV